MSRASDAVLDALPIVFDLIERAIQARPIEPVLSDIKRDVLRRAYGDLLLERQRIVLARAKGPARP